MFKVETTAMIRGFTKYEIERHTNKHCQIYKVIYYVDAETLDRIKKLDYDIKVEEV